MRLAPPTAPQHALRPLQLPPASRLLPHPRRLPPASRPPASLPLRHLTPPRMCPLSRCTSRPWHTARMTAAHSTWRAASRLHRMPASCCSSTASPALADLAPPHYLPLGSPAATCIGLPSFMRCTTRQRAGRQVQASGEAGALDCPQMNDLWEPVSHFQSMNHIFSSVSEAPTSTSCVQCGVCRNSTPTSCASSIGCI